MPELQPSPRSVLTDRRLLSYIFLKEWHTRIQAYVSLSFIAMALCCLLTALCASGAIAADAVKISPSALVAPSAEQVSFFESKIRPLLVHNCYACHTDQRRGGLRLDSRADLLKGGAHGEVILPADPMKSPLLTAVRYEGALKMPPTGKLRSDEIAALTAWVKMGAPWPDAKSLPDTPSLSTHLGDMVITDAQKRFWSFQPVKKPVPPRVKNSAWGLNPIDRFVLARLESKGMKPAPAADRRTLIRRVSFDLIGLPPTPQEVEAFVNDRSPNAWEKVIDRLLAMPQYGERWGRHWLDIARYADSNGLDENVAFANAFRYRDYVVKAFNQDKPYDQFVREQLAGDLMPSSSDEERNNRITATGFLTLGPKLLAEPDKAKMVMDIVDEQIEVTSKAFLGLTVTCARCHNHKFDPIPTKDYYALAGIFKSTKTMASLNTVAMWHERPLPPTQTRNNSPLSDEQIRQALAALSSIKPQVKKTNPPMAMAVEDAKGENCRVHIRGDTQNLGDEVPRHFLTVLNGDKIIINDNRQSGRLGLAQWLTRSDHPLTSRVEVNRIWQQHFGVGLVSTPDNWGFLGMKPSHPELLDWLAATFVEQGWSVKKMHRLILTSNAYKMGTTPDAATREIGSRMDPENTLLWKMPLRRLEAEPFRDALLFVSGKLDLTIGGSLLTTRNHDYVTNDQSGNAATYNTPRRSLYLPIIRNALFDMFQAFDYGDPSMVNAKRATTTVAPQALYVMNSPFVIELSKALARSLLSDPKLTSTERIRLCYLKAYSRPPSTAETQKDLNYLAAVEKRVAPAVTDPALRQEQAWSSLCQLIFASNEFIYLN